MATSMTSAFGIYVAVGMAVEMGWDTEGVACPGGGLGMSTKAQLDGVGVVGPAYLDAQLENISAHRIRT
jgi:hypothetical protein